MWDLPSGFYLDSFAKAWLGSPQEGFRGLGGNFWNSMYLTIPATILSALLGSIIRRFKFGREVEEALEEMMTNPPQEGPDPEQAKAQAEMEKMQMEAQSDQQLKQIDIQIKQMEQQTAQMKAQSEQARIQADMEKTRLEMEEARENHIYKMRELRAEDAVTQ